MSFLKAKYIFDKKFDPPLSSFHNAQKSETSASYCETEEYNKRSKQPAANILRLAGGWGQERLGNIMRRSRKRQKCKTTNKREQNKCEKDEEAAETMANDPVEKHSSENILQRQEKPSENQPIKNMALPVDVSNTQSAAISKLTKVLHDKYQNLTNEPINGSPTALVTSSFVENLLEQTCPLLCTKCDTDKLIPIRVASDVFHFQDKPTGAQSDVFGISPPAEEIHKRVNILEEQVSRINSELKILQRILVPTNNAENIKVLSKLLSEVSIQMVELRDNISKLQNKTFQKKQDEEIANNDAIEPVFQNYLSNSGNCSFEDCAYGCLGPQQFSETCNCEIYKKSQMPAESCRCMCNCINYTQTFVNHCQQTVQDVTKNSLRQRNEMPVTFPNADTLERQRKCENSHLLSQQLFLNEPAQVAACRGRKCDGNIPHSSGYPSTTPTLDGKLITPMGRVDANNFPDGFVTDSSLPETVSSSYGELPLTSQNISKALRKIIGDIKSDEVALTVYPEPNTLHFINVSHIRTGQCLGYIYTNQAAFKKAREEKLFDNFLVFSVLNSKNFMAESSGRTLGNSFEFIDIEKHVVN